MDANKKDSQKKAEDVKGSMKTDKGSEEQRKSGGTNTAAGQDAEQQKDGGKIPHHTSQGHSTGATGSATSNTEPTLRSATTDSSRTAKNSNDDLPTGGNIR